MTKAAKSDAHKEMMAQQASRSSKQAIVIQSNKCFDNCKMKCYRLFGIASARSGG